MKEICSSCENYLVVKGVVSHRAEPVVSQITKCLVDDSVNEFIKVESCSRYKLLPVSEPKLNKPKEEKQAFKPKEEKPKKKEKPAPKKVKRSMLSKKRI